MLKRIISGALVFVSMAFNGWALADWHEVRTENFLVRGDARLSTLEKFAVELEDYREFLGAITYGRRNDEPVVVPVYILSSDNSFDEIYPSRYALGVYTQRISSPLFVGNAARSRGDSIVRGEGYDTSRIARIVIKHEYVHHYTYKNGPTYYPVWYREGLAEYLSTFENDDGTGRLGVISDLRGLSLRSGDWISWEDLFSSVRNWDGEARGNGFEMAYSQSWLATHFIRHSPEYAPALEPYLDMIRKDPSDPLKTFEQAFGKTPSDLGREMKRYFRSNRFSVLGLNLSSYQREWDVTSRKLDKWEEEFFIAYAKRFFIRSGDSHAERRNSLAEDLLQLHEERPNDPRPLIELSFLQIDQFKDKESAEPYIALLEEIAPENAETLLLRGLVTSGPEARTLFDQSREAGPTNARAHYEYAKTFTNETDVPPEAAQAALTAMKLSANTEEVPLLAADLLDRIGQPEDAAYILEPLTVWPRNDAFRARAQALLDRIESGD